MLTLVGSKTSPFVRFVRTVMEEIDAPYQLDETTFFATAGQAQDDHIERHNPLMKVPVLIDDDHSILDSRIIVTHLLKYHTSHEIDLKKDAHLSIEQENMLSVILGIIDAGVLRFIMGTMHPDMDMDSGYLQRSHDRMLNGLAWLNEQPTLGKDFGIIEIALICGLDWFSKRKICTWDNYSGLTKIHNTYRERPSLLKTQIPITT